MDLLTTQLAASLLLFAGVLGPGMLAVALLQHRKRRERVARRSPLSSRLMRDPGETLRERLEELRDEQISDLTGLMLLPALALAAIYVTTVGLGRSMPPWVLWLGGAGLIGYSAYVLRRVLRRQTELDRLRLGLDAERATGQALTRLLRQGAEVFHDVPGEKFNVDHVVVARQGVFAVETKGYRKPVGDGGTANATVVFDGRTLHFPGWSSSAPLRQAERQAHWLTEWLSSATGEATLVTPVLALPGWFVQLNGKGSVMPLNDQQLEAHLLKTRGACPISAELMQRIFHQLDQRCRTVKPLYRPDTDA